jgi:hypothetical protein
VDPRGELQPTHSGRQRTQLLKNRPPRSQTIIGRRTGWCVETAIEG